MLNFPRKIARCKQWGYRIASVLLLTSIPLLRKAAGEGAPPTGVLKGIDWQPVDADGVHCEWLTPPGAPPDRVLIFLHGGGFVQGLYNSSRWLASYLSKALNSRVLMPDYRLAPEHPFPAALDDCVVAYRWLLSHGFIPERILIAGVSAGGHLALGTLLAAREAREPLPAAAILISPAVDLTCSGRTMRTNAFHDALLSPRYARTVAQLYVRDHDLRDPCLSPLMADLHDLPPLLIQVGANEILLDDSRRLARRAKAAGVDVTLEVWPHMWHAWHHSVPGLAEANRAIERIAMFAKLQLQLPAVVC